MGDFLYAFLGMGTLEGKKKFPRVIERKMPKLPELVDHQRDILRYSIGAFGEASSTHPASVDDLMLGHITPSFLNDPISTS